jgi:rod shape-determining protein MreC
MGQFKRLRDAAIAVVLLVIPFFVLSANLRDPTEVTLWDQPLLQLSAPFQSAATAAAHWTRDLVEDYVYLVEVEEDNEALRARVARLETDHRRLEGEGLENRRLRSLLGLRERIAGEVIASEVIARDISPFFRVTRIEIDRGERDRVRTGMPVISGEGLVGEVRRTFGRYADVQLIVDRASAVDVIIQRTGAFGMLRGTGESDRYMCRIAELEREDTVRVGDLVHTSGFGQRFPASILVGRVTRIVRQDSGLWQELEITPAVDFSRLDAVLVLTEGARRAAVDAEGEDDETEPAEER